MAISPQRLTIYLYIAHRAVIFAIAQLLVRSNVLAGLEGLYVRYCSILDHTHIESYNDVDRVEVSSDLGHFIPTVCTHKDRSRTIAVYRLQPYTAVGRLRSLNLRYGDF